MDRCLYCNTDIYNGTDIDNGTHAYGCPNAPKPASDAVKDAKLTVTDFKYEHQGRFARDGGSYITSGEAMKFESTITAIIKQIGELEGQLADIRLELSSPDTDDSEPLYKQAAMFVCANMQLKAQLAAKDTLIAQQRKEIAEEKALVLQWVDNHANVNVKHVKATRQLAAQDAEISSLRAGLEQAKRDFQPHQQCAKNRAAKVLADHIVDANKKVSPCRWMPDENRWITDCGHLIHQRYENGKYCTFCGNTFEILPEKDADDEYLKNRSGLNGPKPPGNVADEDLPGGQVPGPEAAR